MIFFFFFFFFFNNNKAAESTHTQLSKMMIVKYSHEVIVLVTVATGAAAPGFVPPIAVAGGLRMCVNM